VERNISGETLPGIPPWARWRRVVLARRLLYGDYSQAFLKLRSFHWAHLILAPAGFYLLARNAPAHDAGYAVFVVVGVCAWLLGELLIVRAGGRWSRKE
jgi:hypothetical protein